MNDFFYFLKWMKSLQKTVLTKYFLVKTDYACQSVNICLYVCVYNWNFIYKVNLSYQ